MDKNTIEVSSYENIAYALIIFNICLVGVCIILTPVFADRILNLTVSEAIETT